jgi:hypothetical protein
MTSRVLLAAIPLALGLAWQEASPLAVFVAALVSIVPLVGLIGDSTERLAARLASLGIGPLLDAKQFRIEPLGAAEVADEPPLDAGLGRRGSPLLFANAAREILVNHC